jgi:SAM-dependent methyltransferase
MNVVLDRPLLLSATGRHAVDANRRQIWPASIGEIPVWLYRWPGANLHGVEVLSPQNLRSILSLGEGDDVSITVDSALVRPISWISAAVWWLLWYGRERWVYTTEVYNGIATRICMLFNAVQTDHDMSSMQILRVVLASVGKRLPIVGTYLRRQSTAANANSLSPYVLENVAAPAEEPPGERGRRQLQNVLNYTKTSGSSYSASIYPAGYHTLRLPDWELPGQRDPRARLDLSGIDFSGKSVLDLGCNQGGMLLPLAPSITWGVGLDYDHRMVNAATRICRQTPHRNLDFYVFDLDREPLELIENFLPDGKADICFLLSVCMWLTRWEDVMRQAARLSSELLFEANGTAEQQRDQVLLLSSLYQDVRQLSDASEDDAVQKQRKLYRCSNSMLAAQRGADPESISSLRSRRTARG